MKIEIPKQLRNENFRFCIIPKGSKISKDNHNIKNYKWNNEYFQEMLGLGYNYGILGGYENLIIIDVDDEEKEKNIEELNLPETFTILSATKKKPHKYYITEEKRKTRRTKGLDIIGIGNYAIGGNCIIEKNKELLKYEIKKDIPIAKLNNTDYEKLIKIIDEKKTTNNEVKVIKKTPTRKESYYLDKKLIEEKTNDFIINDILKRDKKRMEIIVTSIDENIIRKTFDLNKYQELKFLKQLLKGQKFKMKSEKYTDKNGIKRLRLVIVNN